MFWTIDGQRLNEALFHPRIRWKYQVTTKFLKIIKKFMH
jgi:hypothetical protein